MKIGFLEIPAPLCNRHLDYVMKDIMTCPECQSKMRDFINLPIVGNAVPPLVKEAVLKLIPGGKDDGEKSKEDWGR